MELALKIVNGRVEVYEDGAHRHSYGSHIEDAATDGKLVAAVTRDGRIEEYRDGMCQRSYGSNARKVRISGNTLAVTLKDGGSPNSRTACAGACIRLRYGVFARLAVLGRVDTDLAFWAGSARYIGIAPPKRMVMWKSIRRIRESKKRIPLLELLTELVEKSLVAIDAEGSRYHLLETVRQYALEQLEKSGEVRAIRSRHLEYYLAFASKARTQIVGPDQAEWMARVDQERDNLLAAHAWCDSAEGGQELGLRLVSSLKVYWINRGLLGLARGVAVEALARAPARSRNRARTLFFAGQVCPAIPWTRESPATPFHWSRLRWQERRRCWRQPLPTPTSPPAGEENGGLPGPAPRWTG